MLGLRLQIVVAIGALMALAFAPLYLATASLVRASAHSDGEREARAHATLVADLLLDAFEAGDDDGVDRIERRGLDGGLVTAVHLEAGARTHAYAKLTDEGRVVEVERRSARGATARVRVRAGEGGPLVPSLLRVVAFYTGTFALALLAGVYVVMTRLVVRPVEALARAAERVAQGGRALDAPTPRARELSELSQSLRSMTAHLFAQELALRRRLDELERTTARLDRTTEQLAGSARMASIGRLAAGVAHEIGNPLAAIMGMHDLIEDGDLPRETAEDFLRRMKKETERIHGVVRDLLELARPSADEGDAPSADVHEVFDDVLALLRPQKSWQDIACDVRCEAPHPLAAMSSKKLTQIVLNLALNAADAIHGTGRTGGTITLSCRRREGAVEIAVEDDGPGVPAELREKIFDPFVTTKEVGRGTGLGLAVCRSLVEAARGALVLDASATSGARFVVTLPEA